MKGRYQLSGQILMLPIEGEGDFSAVYGNNIYIISLI